MPSTNYISSISKFVTSYEDNSLVVFNVTSSKVIVANITADDFGLFNYSIDGYDGNKYDFGVYAGITYLDFTNFQEGQEITCIFNILDVPHCLLIVSAIEIIKWLNNEVPTIDTNAKITFYKSNNIIYAEIKKEYIGSSGSDSGS